jgi:hypothetical protein
MPRIKIKFGETEIEYEGDQKFISGGLMKLIKEMLTSLDGTATDTSGPGMGIKIKKKPASGVGASTSSIAQSLGVKSGPELAIAAAAHLNLVKNKDKISHKELRHERSAHHGNRPSSTGVALPPTSH